MRRSRELCFFSGLTRPFCFELSRTGLFQNPLGKSQSHFSSASFIIALSNAYASPTPPPPPILFHPAQSHPSEASCASILASSIFDPPLFSVAGYLLPVAFLAFRPRARSSRYFRYACRDLAPLTSSTPCLSPALKTWSHQVAPARSGLGSGRERRVDTLGAKTVAITELCARSAGRKRPAQPPTPQQQLHCTTASLTTWRIGFCAQRCLQRFHFLLLLPLSSHSQSLLRTLVTYYQASIR